MDLTGLDPTTFTAHYRTVPDLIAAIEDYLAAYNNEPKPLVWTATAGSILEKVARGRVAFQTVNQN